ncbi:MAG: ferrous iron transporter B [Epulopiscium sp. Nele67-Bin004]|nr:MAG: ferrous iron transporter B [Epulopiscium sp. Nele67-Bin004]
MQNRILLFGNPNVGKSVVFSELTGVHVMSANYAGTTVSYTKGNIELLGTTYEIVDVPGIYSLEATSEAEKVAMRFIESGATAIVCVLDATNLTRNLNLALEIKNYNVPVIFALNLVDIAERKGMKVSASVLEQELGAPVIPTVAVKGVGLDKITQALTTIVQQQNGESCSGDCAGCKTKHDYQPVTNQKEIWEKSEYIAKKCTTSTNEDLKFIDKLGQKMVQPMPGIPIALLISVLSLVLIVFGGKGLRVVLFLPIVNGMIVPFFSNIISSFGLPEMLNNILIGEYGIFVIGFEWPISLIMPYVTLFYIVFTFLEDCGVLPRMAILFDAIMRKMGMQGGSLISLMMGYGCAVPAIIGSRAATTYKERVIITAMVCFAVPCISQSAALIALLGGESMLMLFAMILLSFGVIFTVAIITGKLIDGKVDPIIIEVPNLLVPEKKSYFKKLSVRLKGFLLEAEGPMLVAIVIAAVFKESGMLDIMATALEPLLSGMLGLPKEAVIFLLLGVVRREMAVAPLLDMALSPLQIFVGATVALLYIPCLSVFGIISKEFNSKVAVAIGVGTFCSAILLGSAINFIGQIIL